MRIRYSIPVYLLSIMGMLLPLQFYRIEMFGLNWSLDRVILVTLIPYALFFYLRNGLKTDIYTYVLLLWMLLIFVSNYYYSGNSNASYASLRTPSLIQMAVLSIAMLVLLNEGTANKIFPPIFKVHFIVILFFVLYSIYYGYILDMRTFKPPFMSLESYYAWVDSNPHELGQMYERRLTLPFSTSPYLSFVAGVLSIHFYSLFASMNKRSYLFASILSFLIVIGTFSRSGLLALIIVFFFSFSTRYRSRKSNRNSYIMIAIIAISLLAIDYYANSGNRLGQYERIFDINISEDASLAGHWAVRVKILRSFFDNGFVAAMLGNGIGSTNTILTVSSGHMSYATVLFEQGVLGEIIFVFLLITPLIRIRKKLKSDTSSKYNEYYLLSIYLITAHLFYDSTSFSMMWLYNGYLLVATKRR